MAESLAERVIRYIAKDAGIAVKDAEGLEKDFFQLMDDLENKQNPPEDSGGTSDTGEQLSIDDGPIKKNNDQTPPASSPQS